MRGQGANILILEEAAYIKENVFFEVVVPLMGMNNVSVLGISTPEDEFNYYSQLVNMKKKRVPGDLGSDDTEEGVFLTIPIGLSCDNCRRLQIKDCPHKEGALPPWKSAERQELTESLMASNQARMARELHGAIAGSSVFCFTLFSRQMFQAPPHIMSKKKSVLHLGIDPSGGGGSDTAYFLTTTDAGNDVILAYHAANVQSTNESNQMLEALFARIRNHPLYRDALVIVYVEANMSWLIGNDLKTHMCNSAKRNVFGRVEFEMHWRAERKMESVGVITDATAKQLYVDHMRRRMSDGRIKFAHELLGEPTRLALQRDELRRQCDAYRQVKKESLNPEFVDDKYAYTCKSSGLSDDLIMAMQITLYNMVKKLTDPQFLKRCQVEGLVLQ